MKKIILGFMLLTLSTFSFSQQNNPSLTLTKQDYLKKSKSQKKTAWVMFRSGLAIGGSVLFFNLIPDFQNENGSKWIWLSYLGGAATIASIPFFIAASKNKKKAASLSFKNESIPQQQQTSFVYTVIPSLILKINL